MKYFITRLIIFAAPPLLVLIGAEILARRIPNDYANKHAYIVHHRDAIEVLYMGSSHALFGINPECALQPSFNLAHVSQTLDYDLLLLRKFFSEAPGLKAIALPISYFTMPSRLGHGAENWRIKNYYIYYGISSPALSLENRFETLGNNPMVFIKRLKKYYLRNKQPKVCSRLGYDLTYVAGQGHDLEDSARTAALRHTQDSLELVQENQQTLNGIINFARERDIIVLLYSPPAYKTYVSLLDEHQLGIMRNTCTEAARMNRHVFYKDYMSDPAFVEEDFHDADHLNSIGAKKFTRIISTDIARIFE